MSIFFSNRDYRGACQYGSTTFTLPSSKSRKNVFGNYLGNTSNPVSLHVSRWQVSINMSKSAPLVSMTTLNLVCVDYGCLAIFEIYCGCQLYCK
jgi:hypothetical protein